MQQQKKNIRRLMNYEEAEDLDEEIYYTSSNVNLLEEEEVDNGELENDHLPHSFSSSFPFHSSNDGYNINSNNNGSTIGINNDEGNSQIISPSSPSGFAHHDLLASIHSGPTIDSMSIDEEQDNIMDNNNIENGVVGGNNKKPTSIPLRIWNFLTGNVIAHLMIWTNLTLFSGFLILSPYGLKIYNPIIFSFFRGVVLVISLFPIMLFVDRKFKFKSETKLINRAFAFRKKYPSIYGSKYWRWIYSIFYDDKAVIPSFVLARLPSFKQSKQLAWCGALAVVNQLLFVAGLNLTSSTVTGVVQPLVAIMVCVISMMIGRESKSYVKFFGSLIAVVGAISMLVASALTKDPVNQRAMEPDTFENLSPFERLPEYFALLAPVTPSNVAFMFGLICLLGNTMSYSLYLVTQKTLLDKGVPPLTVTFWSFFFGLAVSFISSLYFFPNFNYRRVDLRSILSILYAAIPYGAVQFSLSAIASKMLTPTIVGVYSTISPLVAIITGVFAFGESPSPWILIGAGLILVGVFVVIGHRYAETRSKNKSTTTSNNQNEQLDNGNEIEDKSISSTAFSSAVNLDITPSDSFQEVEDSYEEETPNFKSL